MNVHGACHCGYIQFKAVVDPETVTVCHCTDCQTLSGTAFRITALATRSSFELKTGKMAIYEKPADSSVVRALTFCPKCGSSIYSTGHNDPSADLRIRTGVLNEKSALPPRQQIWRRSAVNWLSSLQEIPGSERQ